MSTKLRPEQVTAVTCSGRPVRWEIALHRCQAAVAGGSTPDLEIRPPHPGSPGIPGYLAGLLPEVLLS